MSDLIVDEVNGNTSEVTHYLIVNKYNGSQKIKDFFVVKGQGATHFLLLYETLTF